MSAQTNRPDCTVHQTCDADSVVMESAVLYMFLKGPFAFLIYLFYHEHLKTSIAVTLEC